MRIIQTVNDTIRLLFNPKTEIFRLSDFLLVRDVDENFLAQVVEVYDDKFDQEANVAKIKLIYRIVNGNEITPFDNYTPSRECEVAKIKQSEIVKCINLKKKTIELGVNYFSKEKMKINTNFFENNCVIFADKFEQTNQIFENLAPKLSLIKNVLILDFSGNCKIDGITPFVAGGNFKLPLSSSTIDYIQQKTLIRAKLETQVVLGDVFEEVKSYLESSDDDYIPFQRFIKVIQTQCRQTPSVELLVLISWLKKYSRQNIFARNKREADNLFKSISKNKITILDLSNIKTDWQKEHFEYIVNTIKNDAFVLIRLNDNNINSDIINNVYLKKKNISLIPSFAYGYKKTPHIMDFAQNYILMPTLNPKRDFNHANFQVQSLNKESYMIFGDDTKDFIFTLENKSPAKNINKEENTNEKVFISLNLQLEDMTPLELRPNNFEIKQTEPKRKRLQEEIKLSDVLSADKNDEDEIKEEIDSISSEENEISDINTNNNETFIIDAPKPVEIPLDQDDETDSVVDVEDNNEIQIETKEDETSYNNSTIEEEDIEENQYEENTEEEEDTTENEEILLGEDELDFFEQIDIDEDTNENVETEDIKEYKTINTIEEDDNLPKIKEEKENIEKIEPENELEAFAMAQKNDTAQENKETDNCTDETQDSISSHKNEIKEADDAVSDIINQAVLEQAESSDRQESDVPNKEDDDVEFEIKEENPDIENSTDENDVEENNVEEFENEDIEETKDIEEIEENSNEEYLEQDEDEKADFEQEDSIVENETTPDEEFFEQNTDEDEKADLDEKNNNDYKIEAIADIEPGDNYEENEFKNAAQSLNNDNQNIETETLNTNKEDDNENILKENLENEENSSDLDDEIPLTEEEKIEKQFNEILNETATQSQGKNAIKINENISIDIEKIKQNDETSESKLPIFDEDKEIDDDENKPSYKEGDKVSHHKYGNGEILKVIRYGERCLLQIDFPEVGKRLLDPKIAKIELVNEN